MEAVLYSQKLLWIIFNFTISQALQIDIRKTVFQKPLFQQLLDFFVKTDMTFDSPLPYQCQIPPHHHAHDDTPRSDYPLNQHESNLSLCHWSSSFHSGNVSSWPQNCLSISNAKMVHFLTDWLKKTKTLVTCAPSPLWGTIDVLLDLRSMACHASLGQVEMLFTFQVVLGSV